MMADARFELLDFAQRVDGELDDVAIEMGEIGAFTTEAPPAVLELRARCERTAHTLRRMQRLWHRHVNRELKPKDAAPPRLTAGEYHLQQVGARAQ